MSTKASPKLFPCLALGLASLIIAGCQNNNIQRDPLPYSPNYHVADISNQGVVSKSYEKQRGGRLVPDVCVTPDVTENPLYLPPGCANNLNLQMMVERESDLLHGRDTGPAMAQPVVRAARRIIDGTPNNPSLAQQADVSTTGLTD
jgi:hypothetical protein